MAGSPLPSVVRELLVGVALAFHLTDIGLSFECHHIALAPGIELPVLCERGWAVTVFHYDLSEVASTSLASTIGKVGSMGFDVSNRDIGHHAVSFTPASGRGTPGPMLR